MAKSAVSSCACLGASDGEPLWSVLPPMSTVFATKRIPQRCSDVPAYSSANLANTKMRRVTVPAGNFTIVANGCPMQTSPGPEDLPCLLEYSSAFHTLEPSEGGRSKPTKHLKSTTAVQPSSYGPDFEHTEMCKGECQFLRVSYSHTIAG